MEIELLFRVPAELTEDQLEEQRLERLLDKRDPLEPEPEAPFTYRPYVLNLDHVKMFGEWDEEHTEVRLRYGFMYPKINYHHFKALYQTATSRQIKTMDDFRFVDIRQKPK